ncbi:MAG: nucleotidyltransferase family protein [Bacillota bacterium]
MIRTAILLAAGRSRRFGVENKLLHIVDGKTMLEIAIHNLQSAAVFDEIVVVCGHQQELVAAIARQSGVSVTYSREWECGIAESIKAGVLAATTAEVLLFMPADMPYLSATTIAKVALAVDENHPVVCTKNNDYLGVPTAFLLKSYREELLALAGDQGAKHILTKCINPVVIAASAQELVDIDYVSCIGFS